MNIPILLVFLALVACKFAVVILEPPGASLARVPVALAYTALFASPQLMWLKICVKPFSNLVQGVVSFIVAVVFFYTSLYFGFVPGTRPPSWASDAHFEVPFGFAVEWSIALLAYVVFRSVAPSSPSPPDA